MNFDILWKQLFDHGATTTRRSECYDLWQTLTSAQQEALITTITNKIKEDKFIHYDPLRAMRENIRKPRQQVISYDDYVQRYHTDLEKDGWHRKFQPEEHKTIYVKC